MRSQTNIRQRKNLYGVAAAVALPLFVAVAALWLGEHHRGFLMPYKDFVLALVAPLMFICLFWRIGRKRAIAVGAAILVLFVVVWFAGAVEKNRAFNECVEDGESVRVELANYQARHGVYPTALGDLNTNLPGQLLLPPHSLHYERTPDGYRLSFADFLVSHRATESEPFTAHK